MSRLRTCEALVLRTYDVGEADRFCILFSKEYGRFAARVAGIRRPLSRRGSGTLLPFHRVVLECSESKVGYIIEQATLLHRTFDIASNSQTFFVASGITEFLLKFTDDHLPLPDVYDASVAALASCRESQHSQQFLFAYALKILAFLDHIPSLSHSAVSGCDLSPTLCAYSRRHTGFCLPSEDPFSILFPVDFLLILHQLRTLSILDISEKIKRFPSYIQILLTSILVDHLGLSFPLIFTPVPVLGATPICMVAGRAS